MTPATTDQPTPTGDGPEVWPPLIDSLQEQIYLASRREEAAPLIPQPPGRGASITHSDATRRSVTSPLSAVSVTYGS